MGRTIIHSVNLFDGWIIHPNTTVDFDSDSGLITSVKSTDEYGTIPQNTTIIDGTGHTLLPGLIEAHMHSYNIHLPDGVSNDRLLETPLRCGITTLCDMHSDPPCVERLRVQIKNDFEQAQKQGSQGRVRLSDLKSSLFGATIPGGWPKPIVLGHNPSEEMKLFVDTWPNLTVSNAMEFVKSHKKSGANYIKLMQENCCSLALPTDSVPSATLELQTAIVKAAHSENMVVVGHALSLDNTDIILRAGADGLTHTFIDQAPNDRIVELYKITGAFCIPTLCVLASLTNEDQEKRHRFAEIASQKGLIDDFTKENMCAALGMKAPEARLEYAYNTVKRLHKAGIDIVAGTDAVAGLKGTAVGPSLWMELDAYVNNCGMSVLEALSAATAVSAKRFRFDDRGTVEKGKRADLVLVNGDIKTGIQCLWEEPGIVGVWKAGFRAG